MKQVIFTIDTQSDELDKSIVDFLSSFAHLEEIESYTDEELDHKVLPDQVGPFKLFNTKITITKIDE